MAAIESGRLGPSAREGTAYGGPGDWLAAIPPAGWGLIVILLFLPAVASSFILIQIVAYALILGMIALSLMFLAGYGGIVSLVQMTVAGCAGYMVAIFGTSGVTAISLNWPWWLVVPVAVIIATAFGTISGALSVRTEGIYTIMITLAIASAFFYFTLQNYTIFNGFSGFNGVLAPQFWGIRWQDPLPFYYLCLAVAALAFFAVTYVSRAPFGLALQGTRDNARRMAALGFNVSAHRIAAYTFASVIAALAGVLLVWYQAQISPGTAGVGPVVDILIIAVVGGLSRPIGPFIGALIFVLLRTFSLDVLTAFSLDAKRFQLVIGCGFLIILLFSPDGILGIWKRIRPHLSGKGRDLKPGDGEAPR